MKNALEPYSGLTVEQKADAILLVLYKAMPIDDAIHTVVKGSQDKGADEK